MDVRRAWFGLDLAQSVVQICLAAVTHDNLIGSHIPQQDFLLAAVSKFLKFPVKGNIKPAI